MTQAPHPTRPLAGADRHVAPIERLCGLRPAAAEASVVAVIAPAGYGKTTTVAGWLARSDQPGAWVSLDRRHNDPVALATDVARMVLGMVPDGLALREVVDAPAASVWSALMPRVAAALEEASPYLLVFDDVHELTSQESLDIVNWLAVHVPPGSQLIIAGRSSSGLVLPRLRLAGTLGEVGRDELCLTDAEAAVALEAAGSPLSSERVTELNATCEGWVSGLLMAGMSSAADSSLPGVTERTEMIGEYVRSEVLDKMSPTDVDFLLDTSVLRDICAPLVDAVRGASGSGQVLERLADSNVFIARQNDGHYRYHELFREALLAQATRRDPTALALLRARAARWHADAGDLIEAVRYAQESGDTTLAADFVSRSILPVFNAGRGATITGWLDWAESEPVALQDPRLLHGGAIVLALRGEAERADRWAVRLDALFAASAGRPSEGAVEASVRLLDGFFCRSGVEVAMASARRALELLVPGDVWREAAKGVLGLTQLATGLEQEAIETYLELTDPSHDHEPGVNVRAVGLTLLARADLDAHDLAAARAHIERALSLRAQAGITGQGLHAISDGVAARLAMADGGDTESARRYLAHAQTVRPLLTHAVPLISIVTRLELARAHLAVADAPGARLLVRELGDALRLRPRCGHFETAVEQLRAQLDDHLETAVGPSALTVAELRLLPWLATHLSFREIGERLFLSATTIKTEALAIYRKLGASSRSEAVVAAVRVGLMDPATLPGVLRHDASPTGAPDDFSPSG